MIKILAALAASAIALLSASCCCTSDPEAPELRPLPQFQQMPIIPESSK